MIKIEDKNMAYFDVDDTLVKWECCVQEKVKYGIAIDGECLVPHRKHVEALKRHKARGHTIVVWSQGGSDWAELVIKTLHLEEYVDIIISKPHWFYDDHPSSQFLPESIRVYKEDDNDY